MKTALEKHIELNHYNPSVLEHIFECVRLGKQDFAEKEINLIEKIMLYDDGGDEDITEDYKKGWDEACRQIRHESKELIKNEGLKR